VLSEKLSKPAVMVVIPAATAMAKPLLFIVATDVLDELQLTSEVKSWVVPSENVPVAVNSWLNCRGMLGLAGVITMEDKAAEVTVSVVLPEILDGGK